MLKTNPQLDLARKFVTETGANIFLTGKAGTGKTTFLRSVVESISKRYIIVAPTGVAALNAGGVTIHSFFQLPFGPQIPNETRENNFYRLSRDKTAIMRSLELLVIDEISMVRSDLLDAINLKLQKIRRNNSPFGGVQLLMIGDVRQLSPICKPDEWSLLKESYKSPYFFDALSLRESSYITIELLQIFRQSDSEFTNLLNSIRDNRLTQSDLQKLNSRYIDNFKFCRDDDYIMLTTHNSKAAGVNHAQLSSIDSEIYDFDATIEGEFSESIYPNETTLNLKVGAQVIFVKNDSSSSKEFYNGMIATITNIRDEKVTVIPKASNQEITVPMATWDNIEYTIDSESGDIKERVVGSFKQLPIKCAWAITIHKSQGLTFDKVIIDASESFAPGQVYVALSRCRTFEGIILSSKINSLSIIDNSNVSSFCRFVEGNQPDDNILEIERKRYFRSVVCDIFDFEKLRYSLHQAQRLLNNSLLNKHFEITQELNEHTKLFEEELFNVGERFKQQLSAMIFESDDYSTSPLIEERLQKAATYFAQRIETTADIAKQIFKITPTAKEVKKRLKNITSELKIELEIKMMAIEMCSDSFSIEEYLLYKMRITTGRKSRDKKSISTKKIASIESDNSTDAIYPELHNTLTIWRKEEAQKIDKPAFVVMSNRTIIDLQLQLPSNVDQLKEVTGIGKSKIDRYGDTILEMINSFVKENNIDIEQDDSDREQRVKRLSDKKVLKPNTYKITLDLYREGSSVDEIAEKRELARSTIYSHIAQNIKLGELEVTEFVSQPKIDTILEAIPEGEATLSNIKELLGDDYEYHEIKMVLSHKSRQDNSK